ncbi:MAG: two-component regulator propeller domain-containing protein [Thermoanaerobaculaceae bacterium]
MLSPRKSRALFLLAFSSGAVVGAERLNISVYTNEHGLPQRQVLAVVQDAIGYLWVGTYGGLSRFNGRAFVTLRTREGLSSNSISDLVPLPDGHLWVGTGGGGACLVKDGAVLRCFQAPQALPSNDVLDLEPDGNGGVWVATFDGVTHLRPDGPRATFHLAEGKPLRSVWAIKRHEDGVLVGFASGIAKITNTQVELLPTRLPTSVRSLLPTPEGLYVGCERGLFRLSLQALGELPELIHGQLFVQDMAYAAGNLWVATRTGLYHWNNGRLQEITSAHGLPAEVIHRVHVDREGVVWLGTEAGLVKLLAGPFVTFTTADGLPHNFVRVVKGDQRGRLWVGTRGGLALKAAGGFLKPIRELESGIRIYDILPLPDGDLWVATNRGVFQLRNDRLVKVWRESEGLPDQFTFALAFDRTTHELFLGTWAGTVCLVKGQLVPLPQPLREARPISMHVDGHRRLWVGLRDGKLLIREPNGSIKLLGANEGYSDQVVWSIASDARGVWLGTNGDGALHVTETGIERWDRSKGLVDDFVWQILPDRQGRVWLYTSQGLDRIANRQVRHFNTHDGLPDLEGSANACYQDAEGFLWFGTASGLVRFQGPDDGGAGEPPPVLLEGVKVQGGPLFETNLKLASKPGPITFSLVSLSFRNEKSTRYSYRLLPIQTGWSSPQLSGEVTFAALGPGTYRFEAVAVDAGGRTSPQPVSFQFSVARPWWQHPLLAAGATLLVGVAAMAYARLRVRRLQLRAQELELLVAQRTQELSEKAQELARLAESDELTGLANRRKFFITLRAELQRLWRAPEQARLSLMLLDLDGFKHINDTLGHTAGDALLQAVGKALLAAVRSTDTVARFGGDEFAVILPMTDRVGASVAAGKVREAVKAVKVPFAGKTLRVTASVGIAVVAPSAAFAESEVTRLIQRADVALYAAKSRGGDAVLDDEATWI